jgi:chaperonin GroES
MFKPLNERILVRPDQVQEETSFGIVLPTEAQSKSSTGTVVVGSKLAKKDDKVLFSKFGYDEVLIDKELLYVVPEASLLGVF